MAKRPKLRIDLATTASRLALPAVAATGLVLGVGFTRLGHPAWALVSALAVLGWLGAGCLARRGGWIDVGFGVVVLLLALGVELGLGGGWGLGGLILALSGWDLLHFARRLSVQSQPAEARTLQRAHLLRLLLSDLVGAGFGAIALTARISLELVPVLLLSLLAVLLLGGLARWVRDRG